MYVRNTILQLWKSVGEKHAANWGGKLPSFKWYVKFELVKCIKFMSFHSLFRCLSRGKKDNKNVTNQEYYRTLLLSNEYLGIIWDCSSYDTQPNAIPFHLLQVQFS